MWKMLSYPVQDTGINWPGCPSYTWTPMESMDAGSKCNTGMIHIFDHFGTHLDAPKHYNNTGETIGELPFFESFIYNAPLVLDIPKRENEKIQPEDLSSHHDQIAGADILCIRTGFSKIRKADPDLYNRNGPSVSAAAAKYLKDNFADTLKAVGMDFLSFACPADTKDGDEAHREMLGNYDGKHILIIEDCCFDELPVSRIKRIFAIPLRFYGIDSSPVTMFAEI